MAREVRRRTVTGIWWRHVPHGARVYSRPALPADGRWNLGHVVEAWYFADSQETMWAEWYRYLAELGLRPDVLLPRDVWRWRVKLGRVADLSTPGRLARLDLLSPPPERASWPAYQQEGLSLFREGWEALLAPSAARPEGRVLCVFRTADQIPGLKPVPPPRVWRHPPPPPRGMQT